MSSIDSWIETMVYEMNLNNEIKIGKNDEQCIYIILNAFLIISIINDKQMNHQFYKPIQPLPLNLSNTPTSKQQTKIKKIGELLGNNICSKK